MKKEDKKGRGHEEIPDLMFQNVKIPEALAPTPINPALDDANQLNIPRNPGPTFNALDWMLPEEPLVIDPKVPITPNPHTQSKKESKKK